MAVFFHLPCPRVLQRKIVPATVVCHGYCPPTIDAFSSSVAIHQNPTNHCHLLRQNLVGMDIHYAGWGVIEILKLHQHLRNPKECWEKKGPTFLNEIVRAVFLTSSLQTFILSHVPSILQPKVFSMLTSP